MDYQKSRLSDFEFSIRITFSVLSLELVYNPNNLNTSERTRATVQLAIMSEVRVELTICISNGVTTYLLFPVTFFSYGKL